MMLKFTLPSDSRMPMGRERWTSTLVPDICSWMCILWKRCSHTRELWDLDIWQAHGSICRSLPCLDNAIASSHSYTDGRDKLDGLIVV